MFFNDLDEMVDSYLKSLEYFISVPVRFRSPAFPQFKQSDENP